MVVVSGSLFFDCINVGDGVLNCDIFYDVKVDFWFLKYISINFYYVLVDFKDVIGNFGSVISFIIE